MAKQFLGVTGKGILRISSTIRSARWLGASRPRRFSIWRSIGGTQREALPGFCHGQLLFRVPALGGGRAVGAAAGDRGIQSQEWIRRFNRRVGAERQPRAVVQLRFQGIGEARALTPEASAISISDVAWMGCIEAMIFILPRRAASSG